MIFCTAMLLTSFLYADDSEEAAKRQPMDELVFSPDIWTLTLEQVKKTFDVKEEKRLEDSKLSEELKEKVRSGKRIRVDGVKYGGIKALEWLSSAKKGLRSPGDDFTLLGKNVGEVVVREQDGKAASASISLFNRGDDKRISKEKYLKRLDEWKTMLSEKLKVRPESRNKSGVVKMTAWMWKKGDVAYLLEGSLTRKTNRPEFIRLRMASASSAGKKRKTASRRSLADNVKKENGDVYVGGLPMVDQGAKGYCVVASVERVARYYGLNVDQHELAQLANTSSGRGTSFDDMEKAFSRITGKIHVKTLPLVKYDGSYKQHKKDVKSYNRQAKRMGAEMLAEGYFHNFWRDGDAEVYKAVKVKEPKYKGFKRHVKKWVDQGIPLCWTLYLGMFPEREGSQSFGGHMRIIHGYNEAKDEILYTDSWGAGHEMKRMPSLHAWCMTTGLYSMVPTN